MIVPTEDNMGLRQFLEVDKHVSCSVTSTQIQPSTFVSSVDTYDAHTDHVEQLSYRDRLNILVNNYKNTILVGQSKKITINANKAKTKVSNTQQYSRNMSSASVSNVIASSFTLSSSLRKSSMDSQLSSSNNQTQAALASIMSQNTSNGPNSGHKKESSGIGSLFSSSHSKEITKIQKEFIKYMTKQMEIYHEHCNLVISGYELPPPNRNQRTISNNNADNNTVSNNTILKMLNEPCLLDQHEELLDDIADNLIESTMQHYSLTLSPALTSNTELVVKEFSTRLHDSGDGMSKSLSGSKYSYFNKEFKKLSLSDRNSSRNQSKRKDQEFKMINGTSRTNSSIKSEEKMNSTATSLSNSLSQQSSSFLYQSSRTPNGSASISPLNNSNFKSFG